MDVQDTVVIFTNMGVPKKQGPKNGSKYALIFMKLITGTPKMSPEFLETAIWDHNILPT